MKCMFKKNVFWKFNMTKVLWLLSLFFSLQILFVSGCFFGSTIEFSRKDIEGKENLIINGDFEEGKFSFPMIPANWLILENLSDGIYVDKNEASSGERSFKISQQTNSINLTSDSFTLNSKSSYFVTLDAKSQSLKSKQQIKCFFVTFDKEGKVIKRIIKKINMKKKWNRTEFTVSIFKSKAKYGRLIINIPETTKNSIWIDNIGAYEVYKFTD